MRPVAAALILVLTTWGCSDRREGPLDDIGPYVVTAIDYHFHDAHPSLPIAREGALQFSNQGSNRHNVTIPQAGFDRMVDPGERLAIDQVGSLLPRPGRYPFHCKLHADRGMSGVLVVSP